MPAWRAAYLKNFINPFQWYIDAHKMSVNRVPYYQHYFKVSKEMGPVWMRAPLDWNLYHGLWLMTIGTSIYLVVMMKKYIFGELKRKPYRPWSENHYVKYVKSLLDPKIERLSDE